MSDSGSIRVVSLRKGGVPATAEETILRVDRAHPVLGNPHILHNHRDDEERSRVIHQYIEDSEQDWQRQGPRFRAIWGIALRVARGEKIALACWCAPRPCHGDWIRQKVQGLLSGDTNLNLPVRGG